MYTTARWMIAGLVLQWMVGQVSAQQGAGRNETVNLGGIEFLMDFVEQKSVLEELKVSTEQAEKLKQATEKLHDSFRHLTGEPQEVRKMSAKAWATAEKDLGDILSAEQLKRLNEITLQRSNRVMVLSRPEVAKEVGLTEEQQAKIKEISKIHSTAMNSHFQRGGVGTRVAPAVGGNREEAGAKLAALQKECIDKVLALLTDDQKKAWEKLLGEPFKGEIIRSAPSFGNRPRTKNAQ